MVVKVALAGAVRRRRSEGERASERGMEASETGADDDDGDGHDDNAATW